MTMWKGYIFDDNLLILMPFLFINPLCSHYFPYDISLWCNLREILWYKELIDVI